MMPSIIEGYNYDIFISYRQKDNKGDRWVSEFVDSLKTELESTFKEEISVYFDINPHDGLLETHDVDESLKEKLKCLVFIPIISRTYCDPKSFAWEHEFKAFVEQASKDQFGLKIKLPNGNVASRVLPVRIHDLDIEDIKLCESVLGGILRGVEFIYKESGFNRPLKPDDDEKVNLNKTKYRNQITKVALAIKEISLGMKAVPISFLKKKIQEKESFKEILEEEKKIDLERPAKANKARLFIPTAVVALLIIAGIIAYPKIFKKDTLERLRTSGERISVAVMPFQNMTNDTLWNVWQNGTQDILITYLSNSPKELKVRQTESINSLIKSRELSDYASFTPSVASKISQKLEAEVFIYGSIKQAGSKIRLNAQLIDSQTEEILKSFEIDGPAQEGTIFQITDSLKRMVTDFLVLSKLEEELPFGFKYYRSTNSPEAFRCFIYGQNAFHETDFPTAAKLFSQALELDSNFTTSAMMLTLAYFNQSQREGNLAEEAKKWCLKLYQKREQMPMELKIRINRLYALLFETPNEVLKYDKQLLELDDQSPGNHFNLGFTYFRLSQYEKAIPELEEALEIYKKWKMKPLWLPDYAILGRSYHRTGQFKKEKRLYKKAEADFPDEELFINSQQAVLSLTEGDEKNAKEYIDKCISIRIEDSASEATIAANLAGIYSEAGILDKAEEYYRQALTLEPGNPVRLNDLAWFLIDRDRNINEGMELIDKALDLSPGVYFMLDTKGWGLYKQGKFDQSLAMLQKADSLKPTYDHELYLHFEAAKKAVASQKNN